MAKLNQSPIFRFGKDIGYQFNTDVTAGLNFTPRIIGITTSTPYTYEWQQFNWIESGDYSAQTPIQTNGGTSSASFLDLTIPLPLTTFSVGNKFVIIFKTTFSSQVTVGVTQAFTVAVEATNPSSDPLLPFPNFNVNSPLTFNPGTASLAWSSTLANLNNVDNTSDVNKPVSTATQTALNLKQDISTLPSAILGQVLTGLNTALTGAVTASDSILTAFGRTAWALTWRMPKHAITIGYDSSCDIVYSSSQDFTVKILEAIDLALTTATFDTPRKIIVKRGTYFQDTVLDLPFDPRLAIEGMPRWETAFGTAGVLVQWRGTGYSGVAPYQASLKGITLLPIATQTYNGSITKGIQIRNIAFNGGNTGTSIIKTSWNFYAFNSDRIEFEFCRFVNSCGACWYDSDMPDVGFDSSKEAGGFYFNRCNFNALGDGTPNTFAWIKGTHQTQAWASNCWFANSTGVDYGFHFDTIDKLKMANCEFNNVKTSLFYLQDSSLVPLSDITVSGCVYLPGNNIPYVTTNFVNASSTNISLTGAFRFNNGVANVHLGSNTTGVTMGQSSGYPLPNSDNNELIRYVYGRGFVPTQTTITDNGALASQPSTSNSTEFWRINDLAGNEVFTINTTNRIVRANQRIQVGDGSVSTPSVSFLNQTNKGLYNIGANQVAMAVASTLIQLWTATGSAITGTFSATGNITGANLSGTNTGDQTSIAGITGTTAQFNAALTDNDFATQADLTNKAFKALPYVAGRFYRSSYQNNNLSTSGAIAANIHYAIPYNVIQTQTFDRIGVRITTAISGGKVRFGIYSDNNGVPDTRVLDCGEFTASGVGGQDAIVTISQSLAQGNYWLTFVSDSAHTVIQAATSANRADLGELDLTASVPYQRASVALTYGALPASFGTATPSTSAPFGIKLRAG
jgi:hypothetical protein